MSTYTPVRVPPPPPPPQVSDAHDQYRSGENDSGVPLWSDRSYFGGDDYTNFTLKLQILYTA